MQQTKLKTGTLNRSYELDRAAINKESRTVDIAFSSEEPVDRWFGTEILDHESTSVRLGRLRDGAPLLFGHNHSDLIGVVEKASIDSDKKGRATVRFGKSERAEQMFNDVKDGILRNVSVGYRIHKFLVDEETSENRAIDWEPMEISMVTVPADASSQVGRADEPEGEHQTNLTYIERAIMSEKPEAVAAVVAEPKINIEEVRTTAESNGAKSELARVQSILDAGSEYSQPELARQFVKDGKSIDEMRVAILNEIKTNPTQERAEMETPNLDLSEKDKQEYSLFRAINASVTGNWKDAGFELEASAAIEDKLGRSARGFFVPTDIFNGQRAAMKTSSSAAGAEMVGTDHLGDSFIDALTNRSVVAGAGAQILGGLQGNIEIPKLTTGTAWGWVAEDADAADAAAVTGELALSPKTVSGGVAMSRRLLKQSSPSVEQMIRNDMVRGAALAIDLAALSGSGSSGQPTGITNTTGIGSVTGGIADFGAMVDLWSAVAVDNAAAEGMAYVLNATNAGTLMQTAKDSGSGIMVLENGKINGYNAIISNQMATGTMVFGDFTQLVIGMWGVLDIVADTATKAAAGGLVLRAFQDVDIGVRHAESFAKGTTA
ncbi:MAG TPA: phage major capsid protein [Gammaproteobacteria bacterium]|jgi:HK97 family phage major capsid protein/HK97 family phage prohead protease|nr:phage major capsid protein [Gammaproteobacteria bacterium]